MKTIKLTYLLSLISFFGYSQVGVGNTDPKASLDVTASNTATPANTDGILIPRIDNFPTTNPTADQDGMMVFVTGNGTPAKGFYYWDNGSASWFSVTGINTQNTLDQAYDEGGAGAGKDITADNGAITINGTDGLLITGSYGSGNTIDNEITGDGMRMFFNPRKGALRAGFADRSRWDDVNIGDYSFSVGNDTQASGNYAVAFGIESTAIGNYSFSFGLDNDAIGTYAFVGGNNSGASGDRSFAFGNNIFARGDYSYAFGRSSTSNIADYAFAFGEYSNSNAANSVTIGTYLNAESYAETVFGLYNTNYSETSSTAFDVNDRLFVLGNGTSPSARSNALTVYKSGLMNINDEYNMPLTDGTSGQVMTTDGTGNITFQNPIGDADWYEVGTTFGSDDINDNIFTQGNVGIGSNSPDASLDLLYTGSQVNGLNLDYTYSEASTEGVGLNIIARGTNAGSTVVGSRITVENSGNSLSTYGSHLINSASGTQNVGLISQVTGSGVTNYGLGVEVSGGTNRNVGAEFRATSAATTNYGIVGIATGGTTNWAGYFGDSNLPGNGNVYIDNYLEVASSFRYTDGNETPGYILRSNANGDANWVDPSTVFNNTQNTLDQAYDEGGLGAGAIIDADVGPVQINGGGGFWVTGQHGVGVPYSVHADLSAFFMNPRTSATRSGFATNSVWTSGNIGNYSVAMGYAPLASGIASTGFGYLTEANGDRSTAMGNGTIAASFAETALGNFNTNYTPDNTSAFDPDDRLFVVGNGTSDAARHNALTIYKNGLLNINEAYNLPAADGTNGQVLATDGAGQTNFVDASTVFIDNDTQNTLDQAYNEGGAGAGKEIIANNGAVTINGTDGFFVTGTYGFGNTIDDEITGTGTRMFFNPRKAAFRAGYVSGNRWNNANVGAHSTAFGYNTQASEFYSTAFGYQTTASAAASTAFGDGTLASGSYSTALGHDTNASGLSSTALGYNTTASGQNSLASGYTSTASGDNAVSFGLNTLASGENSSVLGIHTISPSYGETVIGLYNTNYSVSSATNFNPNDRVFSIGNGSNFGARSNALTIYKNGTMNINDAYNMPLTDGTNGQVMTTDGAGNVTFQNANVNTDNQQIDNFALSGTTLGISLQNDGVAPVTVDLAAINTDSQQIDNLALTGTLLGISLQNDGVAPATVDLSSINTDNQQIDNLGLVGTVLGISLEDDGIAPVTVDLSSIDTDNQEVDTFSFNSSNNILTLEVEDDGQAAHTVDLSNLNSSYSLARITLGANQSFNTSGWQKVDFDTVDYDVNSDFNTTTNTFDAPTTGYYKISASWGSIASSTSTNSFGVAIYVNGTSTRFKNYHHWGNGLVRRDINSVLSLNAADTVEIYFYTTTSITCFASQQSVAFEIQQIR